jgi:hypothetical protein
VQYGKIPIYIINVNNPDDIIRHERMKILVSQILNLNKNLLSKNIEHEKTLIQ